VYCGYIELASGKDGAQLKILVFGIDLSGADAGMAKKMFRILHGQIIAHDPRPCCMAQCLHGSIGYIGSSAELFHPQRYTRYHPS